MAALPDCILHRHCSVFPAVYDSNVRIVFAVLCDSRKRMERFGKIGRKRRLHLRDADYSTIHSRSFTVSSVLLGVVCAVLLLFDNTLLILSFSLFEMPNLGIVVCVSLLLLNITVLFEYLPALFCQVILQLWARLFP